MISWNKWCVDIKDCIRECGTSEELNDGVVSARSFRLSLGFNLYPKGNGKSSKGFK